MFVGCLSTLVETVDIPIDLRPVMLLTAKLHLVFWIVIGALAVMAAKQLCKERKTYKYSTAPTKFEG